MTFHPSPLLVPITRRASPRCFWFAAVAALALSVSPAAVAQVRSEDRVAAESLFAEGRQLLQAGDYDGACSKLQASLELEPALGTSLNLADCYEKLGRTASAWAEFKSAAAAAQKAGDTLRKATALERAAALEPRLSRLRIELAEPGVSVLQNGEPLSPAVLGSAIPVDPGSYRLEASAPGKVPWSQIVEVQGQGGSIDVHIPTLVDDLGLRPQQPLSQPPAMSAEPSGSQRTVAWVLGGVGVASLAAGTVFGALAASNWSKAEDSCVDYPYQCTRAGIGHADDATSQATVATVAFILGGAALGTSIVLFVTDSDETESPGVTTAFAVGPGNVSLQGSF
jgi:tetratricopeptide (TPR) repeat protein